MSCSPDVEKPVDYARVGRAHIVDNCVKTAKILVDLLPTRRVTSITTRADMWNKITRKIVVSRAVHRRYFCFAEGR